jgi:hypothetical protein
MQLWPHLEFRGEVLGRLRNMQPGRMRRLGGRRVRPQEEVIPVSEVVATLKN